MFKNRIYTARQWNVMLTVGLEPTITVTVISIPSTAFSYVTKRRTRNTDYRNSDSRQIDFLSRDSIIRW